MVIDYSKAKIYKIVCNTTGLIYVGATCKLHEIENIILAPNQPPLYQLKGIPANYTQNQFRKVETPKVETKDGQKYIGSTIVKTRKKNIQIF